MFEPTKKEPVNIKISALKVNGKSVIFAKILN